MRFRCKGIYDNDLGEADSIECGLTAWHSHFRTQVDYQYQADENSLLYGSVTWFANERWGYNLFGRYEFETSQVEEVGGWIQRSWDCIAFRLVTSFEPGYTNSRGYDEEDDFSISIVGWLTDFVPKSILEEDNR